MPESSDPLDQIMQRLRRLDARQIAVVEQLLTELEGAKVPVEAQRRPLPENSFTDWPHAPLHRLQTNGTFIVTASTMAKQHFFRRAEHLELVQRELLSKAKQYAWQLEAWAVFSNHYHFVGHALADAQPLQAFLTHLHADTARVLNDLENTPERRVWFNYWETGLTFQKSYLARLNYVHQNAVHHGLVAVANQYSWCSAAWFERTATPAQVRTIYKFKTDRIRIDDDYDVLDVR